MPTQGVIRRYTFKLYPNKTQAAALDKIRRAHCVFYNAALQERIDAYRLAGKTLTHFDQAKAIKIVRADDPAYDAISADSMSFTLKRLDMAFQAFFRRAKAGAGFQSGFPRYKRSDDYPGFTHRPGQGWRFDFKPRARHGTTTIKGVPGALKWRGEFPAFPYGIKTGDVMLRAGVWWLSVVADIPARMHADADQTGEITFDLVDSFARVSRANSGHAAGPDDSDKTEADGRIFLDVWEVFAAENDGIVPVFSDGYQEAPTGSPQTEGERGSAPHLNGKRHPTGSPQTEGERGQCQSAQDAASTGSLQAGEDRGGEKLQRGPREPADRLQAEVDRGTLIHSARGIPTDSQQTEKGRGPMAPAPEPTRPADIAETEGDRGVSGLHAAKSRPANGPQADRGSGVRRGSCKYRALQRRKARKQARQARQRREALHVWTTSLARRFASLKIISPPLMETTQSGRGDEREHGAEVALKANLNRRVLDQAPGAAIAMLEYKIAERGGSTETVVAPGPAMVGNDIVAARKAARKLQRAAKRAQ